MRTYYNKNLYSQGLWEVDCPRCAAFAQCARDAQAVAAPRALGVSLRLDGRRPTSLPEHRSAFMHLTRICVLYPTGQVLSLWRDLIVGHGKYSLGEGKSWRSFLLYI